MTSSSPPTSVSSGPISPTSRIDALDIARGFALFGVLMVNMLDFSGPFTDAGPWLISTDWWDKGAELFIRVLGEGGFYTIFSFLFGLGFALQLQRARDRDEPFRGRFAIRLLVLMGFGIVHTFLIWGGDILLQYSVAGFFLLAFVNRQPRTMLRWSMGLCGFVLTVFSFVTVGILVFGDTEVTTVAGVQDQVERLKTSSFSELASHRLDDWVETLLGAGVTSVWFVGIFLAGAWIVTSGRLSNWRNERAFLISVLKISVPVAVASKGLFALLIVAGETGVAETVTPLLSVTLGGPALGATYLSTVLLLLQNDGLAARALSHLAPVGRMALTNYLTQSIVAVTLFYGFGFGWYNGVGVATSFALTVCIFGCQMIISRLWLDRFRFGPFELVWRSLTYGRVPAFRVTSEQAVP